VHGFELPDLIRVNQLVRGRIDFDGFRAWYETLPPEQRRALTYLLCEFAHQAGVRAGTWDEALAASGLPASDPVVQRLWFARRAESPVFPLYEFVVAVPEEDLPAVFRLFVYLFGTAEGTVYRGERKEWCNHWWHRDLLDERVVRELLADSRFYMTAMKDDDRIKGRA
jgi:hypothetical protein